LYADRAVGWLFTENETNNERVFRRPNASPYVKDGIGEAVVHGRQEAGNPLRLGPKTAAHCEGTVPPGEAGGFPLGPVPDAIGAARALGPDFDRVLEARRREADEFYADAIPSEIHEDERLVMRQAFAGMLWSKQFYYYPVNKWLNEDVLPPDCEPR